MISAKIRASRQKEPKDEDIFSLCDVVFSLNSQTNDVLFYENEKISD
jgi:hypothetical protein